MTDDEKIEITEAMLRSGHDIEGAILLLNCHAAWQTMVSGDVTKCECLHCKSARWYLKKVKALCEEDDR